MTKVESEADVGGERVGRSPVRWGLGLAAEDEVEEGVVVQEDIVFTEDVVWHREQRKKEAREGGDIEEIRRSGQLTKKNKDSEEIGVKI